MLNMEGGCINYGGGCVNYGGYQCKIWRVGVFVMEGGYVNWGVDRV